MKQSKETSWTVRNYMEMLDHGEVRFDYPIQRSGDQWTQEQASLLMHSYLANYPVPAVLVLAEKETFDNEEGEEETRTMFNVIDGKQRLTNTEKFVKGEFRLHENTPTVKVRGKQIEIAGKYFSELSPSLQESLLSTSLECTRVEDATDEEIEDIFFRLQNGTPLTKQQQGKAGMGKEWAQRFNDVRKHPAFIHNIRFTPLQIRKADDEMTLIQTMMMMDEKHDLKSISSNHAFEYALKFKEDKERLEPIFNKVIEGLDYIHEAFGNVIEKYLLKKIHLPMAIMTALHAKELGIEPVRFKDWASEFEASVKQKGKNYIPTLYKKHTSQGSVKATKAIGRKEEMIKHFDTYLEKPTVNAELDKALDDVKSSLEGGAVQSDEVKNEQVTVQLDGTTDEEKNEEVTVVDTGEATTGGEATEEVTVTMEETAGTTEEISEPVVEIVLVTDDAKVEEPKEEKPKEEKPKETKTKSRNRTNSKKL